MRGPALAIVSAIVLAACGQAGPSASRPASPPPSPSAATGLASPSPAAAPGPSELGGTFGVLATQPLPGEAIQITIVGSDGRIAATTTAQPRTPVNCTSTPAILPQPTVSASGNRVYYLDGDTTVRYLGPDGSKGAINRVPGGGQLASTFSVSPDGRRIAVVSTDYSQPSLPIRIYVEDVPGGGNHAEIFTGGGSQGVPWAMGWHAGRLVLGYTAGCVQGGGPFTDLPFEYHVVDPVSAVRTAALGSRSRCPAVSPLSQAGVACLDGTGQLQVLGWDGGSLRSFPLTDPKYTSFTLSPSGAAVEVCCEQNGDSAVLRIGSPTIPVPGASGPAGWISDSLLLLGSPGKQTQSRIFNTASGGAAIPVAAGGSFVARLPGTLDSGHGM